MSGIGAMLAAIGGSAPGAYQTARRKQQEITEADTDALSQAAMGNALKLFGQGGGQGSPPPQGGGMPMPPQGPPQQPGPPQGGPPPPGGGQGPPPGMGGPGGMPGAPAPPQGWPRPAMGYQPPGGGPMQPQAPVGFSPQQGPMPTGFPRPGFSPQNQGAPPPGAQFPGSKMQPGGPPAPPGAGPQPPQPPGMGGGAPPGAGSGPSGAGGMPVQQVPGGPPQGFDWRQMIKQVFDANPGIDPKVAAGAVTKMLPFMSAASRQEWLMAHNQFLEHQLTQKGQIAADKTETTRRGQDMNLWAKGATIEARRDIAQMTDDRIRDIAGDNAELKTTLEEKREAARASLQGQKDDAAGQRQGQAQAWKSGESDKKLAAQLERAKLSIEGKQTLGQMNIKAKAELTRLLEEGKDIRAEGSAELKRELAKMRGEDVTKLTELKGAQAMSRVEAQGSMAADRQAGRLEAQGARQDKAIGAADARQTKALDASADRTAATIESRESEGAKNRASREAVAARREASQSKAVSSVSDEELDAIAKRVAEYKQAPYAGGGRGIGAAVMSRVSKFNDDYDAKEWGKRNAGVKAFGTGKEAQTVRSIGTAYRHMETLAELGEKLDNGEAVPINRIFQAIGAISGKEEPTNFDAAKQIVVAEVIKAVVATGGGVKERQAAEERVSRAASPEQLMGLINHVYKPLLEGQLEGYRGQYKNATGKDDFDEKYATKTGGQGGGAQTQTIDGKTYVKRDGKWYEQ